MEQARRSSSSSTKTSGRRSCSRIRRLLNSRGLEKHQTKSDELEKLVLEQCAQESYRVATGNIREMTAARECHSTYRRWAIRTNADEIKVPEDVMGSVPGVLYADGTKCKSIGEDGHACKGGDIKVVLGVRSDGHVMPIGTWTGHETWNRSGVSPTETQSMRTSVVRLKAANDNDTDP